MSAQIVEIASTRRCRRLHKGWRLVSIGLPSIAVILAFIFTFNWRLFGFTIMDITYLYLLLAIFLPLCFLWVPANNKAPEGGLPWYDILFVIASIVVPGYFVLHISDIQLKGWASGAPLTPVVFSGILWLLVIEVSRRATGLIFAGIICFFSFFPLFAVYMPGILRAVKSLSFERVAVFHALGPDSIIGSPLHAFGMVFLGYMVFAIVIQSVGAGKFFVDLAMRMLGNTRAGYAKVSIISSGLFGTISGSSTANVFFTGTFTIPAMKKEGFPAYFAGAVETCASAGGMLMPPIMGAVAFVMAEFIGVPYSMVVVVAVVPSVLYYLVLFLQIDAYAARKRFKPSPITEIVPSVWRLLVNNLHMLVSVVVLLYVLFFLRLSNHAPWYATGVVVVLAMFRKETRFTLRSLADMLEGLGRTLSGLIGLMAGAGMIIGSFVITGLAYSLSYNVVRLAGGDVYILLLFAAATSFILGMGVPLIACYIFLAIVVVPGLVAGGVDLMAAHLFVAYAAVWSTITPPVALTAFAAASVAGSDPMKTAIQSSKLGVAKYILPFAFALSPALVLRASPLGLLESIPAAIIGFVAISGAMEGYFWKIGDIRLVFRLLLFGIGLALISPSSDAHLYSIFAIATIFGLYYLLRWVKSPLLNILVPQGASGE